MHSPRRTGTRDACFTTRTHTRAIGAREPVVVFVCRDDRIVAFFGTRDSFRACSIEGDQLPAQLTKALSMLAG